ncbi:carbon-nitrogen hydrolase family protein [Microbacterium sp. 18062]|uniref:carbon-nitrogen hydrolase family protein n=1 Tax=Microbacterium sp. 18062 TaxID=2681410 RepID=UPI001357E2E2|nr:carbon-nitrogen hydrolase family protein [Microbacterium sp. 18062]
MGDETFTVAAAQPQVDAGALHLNAERHARAIREANARLVVFPELSLTGYELGAPAVALDDPRLALILTACRETQSVALVGAPVDEDGRLHIAMLRFDTAGVRVVYRKTWLHADESDRFTPGPGAETTTVDGWTIGLAICRDTGASQHTAQLALLGVDLYAAGVVDLATDLVECQSRAFVISRALRAPVVIASFAGPTAPSFTRTAGHSAVYDASGTPLVEADDVPGRIVAARLSRVTQVP